MTTVSVVTACHSYFEFLPGWAASVAALNRQPDEIVVVTADATAARAAVGDVLDNVTFVESTAPFSFGAWYNHAVEAASGDWVAWIGVDDRYRPHALDGIDDARADVLAFGMQYGDNVWLPSPTRESIARVARNEVPCGSPFRRSMWERVPFQPDLDPFSDWALWVGFAWLGAQFIATGRVDYDYRWHEDTPVEMEPLRTRIEQWAAYL